MAVDNVDLSLTPIAGAFLLNVPKANDGSRVQGVTLVDQAGGDGAHTFTPVGLAAALGLTSEAIAATASTASGLNGLLRLIAQTLLTINSTGGVVDGDSVAGMTLNTKAILNGATSLTPKFAKIAAASSGANTVVAAVTSKKIRVLAYNFISNGTVNAKFVTAAGGADLTGLKYCVANMGICAPFNPLGWFETVAGDLLTLNLSGAVAVGGELVYVEV